MIFCLKLNAMSYSNLIEREKGMNDLLEIRPREDRPDF